MNTELIHQLKKNGIVYKTNESLANYSTWRIGGICDVVVLPVSSGQISKIIQIISGLNIPFVVIGQGSNVLFADEGLHGVMIHFGNNYSQVDINENIIRAQSGAWVPALARKAMQNGLSGIEHTAGIPGTIGGLVVMNGGSQRKSISSHVRRVWAVDRLGKEIILSKDDCCFAYRKSIFQESDLVITNVELELQEKPETEVRKEMLSILRARRGKFPRKEPNCGSVFKSEPQLYEKFGPPGKIIEDLGLKGYRVGAAEISLKHANFIVNKGNAKAKDVKSIIGEINNKIFNNFGIKLKCEVLFINSLCKVNCMNEVII